MTGAEHQVARDAVRVLRARPAAPTAAAARRAQGLPPTAQGLGAPAVLQYFALGCQSVKTAVLTRSTRSLMALRVMGHAPGALHLPS